MGPDSLHNEGVEVKDERHGDDEAACEDEDGVTFLVPCVFQVLKTTGYQKPLKWKLAPYFQEWPDQDQYRVAPAKGDEEKSFKLINRCGSESSHNNIVTIIPNEDHGPEGAQAGNTTSSCIDTATKFTKTPIVALEHVDGERETIGEEHHKVRDCKINDQHVGRAAEGCILSFQGWPNLRLFSSYFSQLKIE